MSIWPAEDELGNDLIQGDGSVDDTPNLTGSLAFAINDRFFNVFELTSDGDDYIEGNGGDDTMYGGLGADAPGKFRASHVVEPGGAAAMLRRRQLAFPSRPSRNI